jgi:hypothetical protein
MDDERNMPFKWVPYLILATCSVGVLGYGVRTAILRSAAPALVVSGGTLFDAGAVDSQRPVVHRFLLRNQNTFAVGLNTPASGCGCTTATVSTDHIAAGRSAYVTLSVESEEGKLTGSASIISTHGGQKAETWFFVTGRVSKGMDRQVTQKVSGDKPL